MMEFADNQAFKNYLSNKAKYIYRRTTDGIQDTEQFQRLFSLFAECRRKNPETDYRVLLINKNDLLNLSKDADVRSNALFISKEFLANRIVLIDSNLSILNSSNSPFPSGANEPRHYLASLAVNGMVVFNVAPNATVNYFIDGEDFGDGIFYTLEEQERYEELKPIESLQDVLNDYRITLTHQNTYLKFFVDKTGLLALRKLMHSTESENAFIAKYKHVLKNKPEYLFHEDIRNYIKQHMRVLIHREVILEDLDRLDIELIDEGGRDLYFIEIKWVGESIGPEGDSIPTKYDAKKRIKPDAVKQVVGYIDELLKEKQNVKYGYLAVFDARKEDLPDSGEGITETDVPEELRDYFPRFVKLKDFRVKNENPR